MTLKLGKRPKYQAETSHALHNTNDVVIVMPLLAIFAAGEAIAQPLPVFPALLVSSQ